MKFEEKTISRLEALLKRADDVLATRIPNAPNVIGRIRVSAEAFHAWKNSCENIIKIISGEDSSYYKNFVDETESGAYEPNVKSAKGIIFALKEDVESGFMTDVKSLAFAEIFSDFIEISEYLIKQDYKDPAASLLGAVLEDSLRKISINNSIPVKKSDGINDLNEKLANGGIYNRLTQKQVDSWRTLRNSADHGKFSEYKSEDVDEMLRGVSRFITEYLE